MPPNGSSKPVTLRPVRDRDTIQPEPPPTKEERDAAWERAIGYLLIEAGLHEKIAVLEREILDHKRSYNKDMAIVAAYDVESTP